MTGRRSAVFSAHGMAVAVVALFAAVIGATDAAAEFAILHPAKDSTLIENPTGGLANGSGDGIFAGRVNSSTRSIRRALLAFDVAGTIPAGSTVIGARLWLNLTSTSAGPATVDLHRVTADWGEGAAASSGGAGAPSTPGDSTWIHRFYDTIVWAQPGGDFESLPHSETVVDQPGPYTWGSTPEMVADVQSWLDDPASAFGWILIGDETRQQTVKRFDSRESADGALRPLLEVDYLPPCDPDPMGPGYWSRQCADFGGEPVPARPGLEHATAPAEPGFADWVVPCAQRYLDDLGLSGIVACEAVLSEPPLDCAALAERKLVVLLLNVCAGRLQTTCPVDALADGCSATTVGDLLGEISRLLQDGDCRRASGCGGADSSSP
jgi:hypothetical protein